MGDILMWISIAVSVFTLVWATVSHYLNKSKVCIKTRNNVLSCLYFVMDMGPSVSSVAMVAIVIMPQDVSVMQLIVVFVFGIMLKKLGRKAKELFYIKIEKD
ncbi:MAG: hypothetical protein AB7U24_08695 [Sulfurimonadaceae bacterium]